MAKIVIFGQRDYAEQAHYYLTHDSQHEVVAFSVTADQCGSHEFRGLPLVPFEDVTTHFPPGDFEFFVPMSGRSMNRLREKFYLEAKAKGYRLISYVSSRAITCHNEIGENCFILERVNLQPFVRVGHNAVIWCNVHVGHHSMVEDHVSLISGTIVCGRCHIGHHSYVSASSVIDSNIRLAEGTLVSIGSVVKKNTDAWGIYAGNPAMKRKIRSDQFGFL